MAASPLFIDSIDTVKKRLRLSGVPSTADAESLIEEAMRNVRVGIFRKLDQSRIDYLVSAASVEAPVNQDQALRQLAETTELKWIRYELMRTIPTLFFDAAPSANQAWNTEGLFRGTTVSDRENELRRLKDDIDASMIVLEGDVAMPNEVEIEPMVFVSPTPPPLPGQSIRSNTWGGWGGC